MKKLLPILCLAALSAATLVRADHHVQATGTFAGKSDHVTTGTASIVKTEGGYSVVLGEDFSLDGAPDPKVGLGKDGYKKETKLGKLQSKSGRQSYAIPAEIDPSNYNEVWIWCERFNVPLGVATLEAK